MLPKFPEFKKLELTDAADILKITSQYDPYSDFDFASMWAWDVNNNTLISELNGNLAAILSEHFTGLPFYSFLGNKDVNRTLQQLFAFSVHSETSKPQLRMVPEVSLRQINLKKFIIEIDLNNYDYIYDLSELSTFTGSKYSTKRKLFNKFSRNYPDAMMRILDLANPEDKNKILSLSRYWTRNNAKPDENLDLNKELQAIQRFLDAGFDNAFCVGVFLAERMIGYDMLTLSHNKYAISHFCKADVAYSGAYEYLTNKEAMLLLQKDIAYLNAEEDLGLPGLRFAKNSLKPVSFLRKYSIKEH